MELVNRDIVRDAGQPATVENTRAEKPIHEKVSYATLVAGKGKITNPDIASASDFDVVVKKSDYVMSREGVFPSIRFSEKVHEHIDYVLRQAIIVRLLGRNIGYKTLFSRLKALWTPKRIYQLVDLDNDYFLVKFQEEEDYIRVLFEGPWTIFGSYLTVQPWSRSFTTFEAHHSHMIICIRLSGLPYWYYTKSLFRLIAAVIGKVVRVDYNTLEGIVSRVMVLLQATADRSFAGGESFRTYVPWMVVTRRWGNYRRDSNVVRSKHAPGTIPSRFRFSVLESGDVEVDPKEVKVMPVIERGKVDHMGHGRRSHKEGNSSSNVVNEVVDEMSAAIPATSLAAVGGGSDVVEINGTICILYQLFCLDNGNMGTDMNVMGKGSVGTIRTTKTIPKRGISLHKHGPSMGSSKSVLSKWILVPVANIDKVAQKVQQHKDDGLTSLENESESNRLNQSTILGGVVDVVAPCWEKGEAVWCFVTALYASPTVNLQKLVWGSLANLNTRLSHPWHVGGDFNFICNVDERTGGSAWQLKLLDDDENVCVDRSVLSRMEVAYFQKLFSSSGPLAYSYPIHVRFWINSWLGETGLLASHAFSKEWFVSKNFVARDIVKLEGDWNWNAFSIAAAKPPCVDGSGDFPVWKPNRNREFTVRSVYAYKTLSVMDNSNHVCRVLANFRDWSNVRMFTWLA
ncbi:hypothetical protein GQ457_04G026880 [Hibiscus cannabinus]